ncbi:cytochrome d ubiquinol oxidase subunit II [Arenimonas terrae]|jgi:cytochrome d ubiquinol oxidase subunit II|uniref:Cytochrome d ubiquinol oxidase subunit II n=1 Tax=Arenimonas terrae TaxID=2546226 RepID=A0A5C4RRU0_9GAMM|nr:cytochrome d ubiquinol oxidase subunit II [Arenimonas terrae]TNJ33674.1 cytochrome d ubiquinol oxidase subunit II [Arenimonas terrae]
MDAWLPLIFMGLMALAMLIYVVLDGYDLGVGLLVPFADGPGKDRMVASIGPFWDANETWLVLGVGLLLVAFPVAHGVILGALYLPVAVMLIGLILRGVAFDFRAKAHDEHRGLWNAAFSIGSLVAALAQGYMIGRYILGFEPGVVPALFALFVALCLAGGYALLGATWLLMKMEGALVRQAAGWGWWALWVTGLGIAAVSIATPYVSPRIFEKWFALPNLFLLMPVPLLTAGLFAVCENHLRRIRRGDPGKDWVPFAAAIGMFVLAFAGLAYSLYPYLVIDRIEFWDAAAAPGSLKIILVGALVTLPMIIGYTIFSYKVFWGRSTELSYE